MGVGLCMPGKCHFLSGAAAAPFLVLFFKREARGGREIGNIVPAFEILFEDFTVAVGWFFSWVSIVTLHPATVFWRAAFPVFPLVLFFSKPLSFAAPWP